MVKRMKIVKLRKFLENKDAEIRKRETMIRNLEEEQKVTRITVRMRMKESLVKVEMKRS